MFSYATPVRFADVDHAGIVYYPRFFHYFHVAFEELWRARIGPAAYSEIIDRDRIGFPAVRAECDFKAPLKFGDTAEIEVYPSTWHEVDYVQISRVSRAHRGLHHTCPVRRRTGHLRSGRPR